jgi:hypothetical protein
MRFIYGNLQPVANGQLITSPFRVILPVLRICRYFLVAVNWQQLNLHCAETNKNNYIRLCDFGSFM